MDTESKKPQTTEQYITGFPEHTQEILRQVRKAIREVAPDAEELINYSVPTFKLHGNLVHFGAYEKHIGFYPTPSGIDHFKEDSGYRFTTYANWRIKKKIIRAVARYGKPIAIPNAVNEYMPMVSQAVSELLDENEGRFPNVDQIVEKTGLEEWMVAGVMDAWNIEITGIHENTAVVGPPDWDLRPVSWMGQKILDCLSGHCSSGTIDEIALKVLVLRFGINLPKAYSLRETGRILGLSHETVRKIEEKAIMAIKKSETPMTIMVKTRPN